MGATIGGDTAAAMAASYLLGAVPFGLLIARARGVDIRRVGSGNVGATNVFRAVGKPWGLLTFACDALKGCLPAAFFPAWAAAAWPGGGAAAPEAGLLCGVAAIAGHNWPVYLKFKGGKGVATSAGVLLGAAPLAMAAGLGVWLVVFLLSRYVSLASLAAAAAVPAFGWIRYGPRGALLPSVLTALALAIVVRHRANIGRLRRGTEHRFEFGRRKRPGEPGGHAEAP
jgi:glycerol-3-phosphate acyltransferase PlsY